MYMPSANYASGGLAGLAQQVRSRGRGDDTMLVHMTPREVGGLQSLARAAGGSLTTNPDTGLPEAGILGSILPILAGGLLNLIAPGLGALGSAALVGAGSTAVTGDLGKGLMAGLGAFGGFGLGSALQGAGAAGAATGLENAAAPIVNNAGIEAATQGLTTATGDIAANAAANAGLETAAPEILSQAPGVLGLTPEIQAAQEAAAAAYNYGAMPALTQTAELAPAVGDTFTQALSAAPPIAPAAAAPAGGFGALFNINNPYLNAFETTVGGANGPSLMRSGLAGVGLLGGLSGAMQGGGGGGGGMGGPNRRYNPFPYQGPITAKRDVVFPTTQRGIEDTSEFNYFPTPVRYFSRSGAEFTPGTPVPPPPSDKKAQKYYDYWYGSGYGSQFKEGGDVNLRDGSFVLDARTVSEVGNGSSSAGQEALARFGGRPIRGPGDGVSDSIPANIDGTQRARVARDEVKFDPEAVARLGRGNPSKGAKKLYALMEKAHRARRSAKRGEDTKVRKGLV